MNKLGWIKLFSKKLILLSDLISSETASQTRELKRQHIKKEPAYAGSGLAVGRDKSLRHS